VHYESDKVAAGLDLRNDRSGRFRAEHAQSRDKAECISFGLLQRQNEFN
jgi:hypothetical protein